MKTAIGIFAICIAFMAFIGCKEQNRSQRQKTESREDGPHYFSNAKRVDNWDEGPEVYRMENSEAICYSLRSSQGSITCKWKNESAQ